MKTVSRPTQLELQQCYSLERQDGNDSLQSHAARPLQCFLALKLNSAWNEFEGKVKLNIVEQKRHQHTTWCPAMRFVCLFTISED
jgi:hypothetical protein